MIVMAVGLLCEGGKLLVHGYRVRNILRMSIRCDTTEKIVVLRRNLGDTFRCGKNALNEKDY